MWVKWATINPRSLLQSTNNNKTQSLGETATAISPKALALLVSHLLYFRFRGAGTAPIIAGLDEGDEPVLCTQGRLWGVGIWSEVEGQGGALAIDRR